MSQQTPEPEQPHQEPSEPKPKGYEKIIARWTIILGISTILLFIATGISAYFLYATDLTLKDTLNATARAAKATEDAVNIASATAKRQLRAYLGITIVTFECPNCLDKRWTPPKRGLPEVVMITKVKNFGATPAYQVHTCTGLYLAESGGFPPDDFTYDCGEFCKTCPRSTIAPGEEATIVIEIDAKSVMLSARNLNRMFNFGTISFVDTFGQERNLPFCWYYQGDQKDSGVACPEHNTAKDD
jgi:hypothetical protein